MLQFQAARFVNMLDFLDTVTENSITQVRITDAGEEREKMIFAKEAAFFNVVLGHIAKYCEELGLPLSAKRAIEVQKTLVGKLRKPIVPRGLQELRSRMKDELESKIFLVLDSSEGARYQDIYPFGEEVNLAFPAIGYDLEEANKSLALGRSTACVMHLQRVIEVVLPVVGAPLAITVKKTWGDFLHDLNKGLGNYYGTTPEKWHQQNPFYRDTIPYLYAIKSAWRDPAFHANRQWTQVQAIEIFDAIKAFVKQVASQMPITL